MGAKKKTSVGLLVFNPPCLSPSHGSRLSAIEGGKGGAKSDDREKAWSSNKSFNTLSLVILVSMISAILLDKCGASLLKPLSCLKTVLNEKCAAYRVAKKKKT